MSDKKKEKEDNVNIDKQSTKKSIKRNHIIFFFYYFYFREIFQAQDY
jgi:hypothetical protein